MKWRFFVDEVCESQRYYIYVSDCKCTGESIMERYELSLICPAGKVINYYNA